MAASAVYWLVLEAVEKHVGKGADKQHFHDFVVAEFRKPVDPNTDTSGRIWLVGDHTYLLASVHHHKDLLFSYNIAVDQTEEMKKIPDVYQP